MSSKLLRGLPIILFFLAFLAIPGHAEMNMGEVFHQPFAIDSAMPALPFLWTSSVTSGTAVLTENIGFGGLFHLTKYEVEWNGGQTGVVAALHIAGPQLAPARGKIIYQVITIPGLASSVPTDAYDITIVDDDTGLDLMDGNLANRSDDTVQIAYPKTYLIPIDGPLTINITNNLVEEGTGQIIIWVMDLPTVPTVTNK